MPALVRLLKTGWSGMKFKKKYSKVTVAAAMLHGVLIGIAAGAIAGFIIVGTNGNGKEQATEQHTVVSDPPAGGITTPPSGPAISPDDAPLKLFARQHGVFTTAQSAQDF